MLPVKNRLTKKKDFEMVFKRGKSLKEGFLLMKFFCTELPECRFAFVTSQKVSKKAVIRNRVRRVLRELVQKELMKFKKSVDVVLIALPGLEIKDTIKIKKDLTSLLLKITS